ncbi:MAG: winged helix-turn-helix transcriptional regulator [Chlorobi bacterium]|nr:winged helix-turn-helix transcriptional regulator [Chlorobiota bacterium]
MGQNICIRALADVDQINACKAQINRMDESFMDYSNMLGLAGNEVRLKILFLLDREGELCVCDLSDILGMNVSAISQHLRKLKDGNIVDLRKDGQTYYYFIKDKRRAFLGSLFKVVESKIEMLQTGLAKNVPDKIIMQS